MRVFFTSATREYLPKVLILAESLKAHNPDAHFVLALLDDNRDLPKVISDRGPIDRVMGPEEILRGASLGWLFQHTIVEACTAIKGEVLRALLRASDAESVTYLDPDIQVFGSFAPVWELHRTSEIILTPHLTDPESSVKGILDNEVSALRHGTYNLGFVSVSSGQYGTGFADWWAYRLRELCIDDLARGVFTDQKWVDLVPGLFGGVAIARSSGLNVSTWNLANRRVEHAADGGLLVNGEALVFAHFSGFDSGNHHVAIAPYLESQPLFADLSKAYARRLSETTAMVGPQPPWAFGVFRDGEAIPTTIRRRYRLDEALRERFPDPYASGPGSLSDHFRQSSAPATPVPDEGHPAAGLLRRLNEYLRADDRMGMRVSDAYRTSEILDSRAEMLEASLPSASRLWVSHDAEAWRSVFNNGAPTIAYIGVSAGGCGAHVDDLTSLVQSSANVLRLAFGCQAHGTHPGFSVSAAGAAGIASGFIPVDAVAEVLPDVLMQCGVDAIHVHHRFGLEEALEALRERFPGTYAVTLHDYAFISPEPHLANRRGSFVGDPGEINWHELVEAGTAYRRTGAGEIDQPTRFAEFLQGARLVIAPSRDCAARYLRVLPELDIRVQPHWEGTGVPVVRGERPTGAAGLVRQGPVRVLVPGEFMPTKGSLVVLAVADLAERMGIDIQFTAMADAPGLPSGEYPSNLEFRGRYSRGVLGDEIRYAGATVGWLPAQVPETYSYAASELMRAGVPIVASRIGALPERVDPYPSRVIVDWDADPQSWLEALLRAHHLPSAYDVPGASMKERSDFYPAEYLRLLLAKGAAAETVG